MKKATLLAADAVGRCALTDAEPRVADGIISRAVLTTPAVRITWFHFAPGQELSEHTSKSRALVQILAGKCEFRVNGERFFLQAGDLLHLPPQVPHALVAPEAFAMLLTQVTEPAA